MFVKEKFLFRLFLYAILVSITYFGGFGSRIPFIPKLYSLDLIFLSLGIVSLASIFLLSFFQKSFKFTVGAYKKDCAFLILLVLFEALFSCIRYSQPVFFVVKESLYYLIPVLCYIAFCQYKQRVSSYEFVDAIINVSIASSIIAMVTFFVFTYFGVNLLNISVSDSNFRNGTLRFDVGKYVVYIALLISMAKFFQSKHSRKDVINVLLGIFQLVVINKTRTVVFYFVAVFILAPLFSHRSDTKWRIISIFSLLLATSLLFILFNNIFQIWNNLWYDDVGNIVRLEAMSFYWQQFCQSPIWGMGFISDDKSSYVSRILRGLNGQFYRDDVGIIGYMNTFGILGVCWLTMFFKNVISYVNGSISQYSDMVKIFVLYGIVTLPNLCIMDHQRIMFLVVMMMLSEISVTESKI